MDWSDFLSALALMLILEGVMPFLSPNAARRVMATMARMGDRELRIGALIGMALGVAMLYVVRVQT